MVKAALARNFVGIIGNVISFGLFVSPAPTFVKIIKKEDVEELKPDPYLAILLNCVFWVFYGLPYVHPNSLLVATSNGVGLVFEFVYITIFVVYAKKEGRKNVGFYLLDEAIILVSTVFLTMVLLHGHDYERSLIVGFLCVVINILMYIPTLPVMKKVIKTKSVKYMPFWLSVANFLNGCCWTTYALIHPFDIYVLISNVIGAIFGFVQLLLHYYFWGENNDVDANHGPQPTPAAV